MTEEDIPAALALWQGLPGIGLRDADSPAALAKYLRRNPGLSFVALSVVPEFQQIQQFQVEDKDPKAIGFDGEPELPKLGTLGTLELWNSCLADAGTLVGVSLAGHDGRRGYLHHVAVTEAYRGPGLGRELVLRCAGALEAEGIEKINLWVKADNAAGRAFWNRVGGRERDDILLVSLLTGDNPNA